MIHIIPCVVPPLVIAVDGDRHIISVEATSTDLHFIINNAIPDVIPDGIKWYFTTSFTDLSPFDAPSITDITGDKAPAHYSYSSDARSLTISNINQTDEGRYYIVVMNPAGISYNHIDIIVYGLSCLTFITTIVLLFNLFVSTTTGPPRFVREPEDEVIINSNSVTFVCEGVADPIHDVLWTFNDNLIISTFHDIISIKYSIQSNADEFTTYGSLTVSDVQYSDLGTYRCFLNNTVDTINASVELQVHG